MSLILFIFSLKAIKVNFFCTEFNESFFIMKSWIYFSSLWPNPATPLGKNLLWLHCLQTTQRGQNQVFVTESRGHGPVYSLSGPSQKYFSIYLSHFWQQIIWDYFVRWWLQFCLFFSSWPGPIYWKEPLFCMPLGLNFVLSQMLVFSFFHWLVSYLVILGIAYFISLILCAILPLPHCLN